MPPSHKIDRSAYPEAAKFMDWYEQEKKNGLLDVKFFPGNVADSTVEEFFSEVNSAIASEPVEDSRDF